MSILFKKALEDSVVTESTLCFGDGFGDAKLGDGLGLAPFGNPSCQEFAGFGVSPYGENPYGV